MVGRIQKINSIKLEKTRMTVGDERMITVRCDSLDCWCNDDGYCEADVIQIDSMQECTVYHEKDQEKKDGTT